MTLLLYYVRYLPDHFGKNFILDYSKKHISSKLSSDIEFYSIDGRRFIFTFPEDNMISNLYYLGDYETGTTKVIKKILKNNQIVFDLGANYGWYTTLLAKIVQNGECHSFEPVPWIFNKLKRNCLLNNLGKNLFLNKTALGSFNGEIDIFTFPDLPHSHSSISDLGKKQFNISKSPVTTLNHYIGKKKINKIDFIKCDIEGSEMEMLKGASDVFSLESPPIWLFEMNEETSATFGYSPKDILNYMLNYYDYKFFRIVKAWGDIKEMQNIEEYENGDNVFCFVPKYHDNLLNVKSLI